MRFDEPEVLTPEQRPMQDRAYLRDHVRHDVRIGAFIVGRAGRTFAATIVDVSSTGLAIDVDYGLLDTVTPGLEAGMQTTVRLPRPLSDGAGRMLDTDVRVMWCRRNLIGVHFVQPDDDLYRTLKVLVGDAVAERAAEVARLEQSAETLRRNRLRATRKVMQHSLPALVWGLRTGLVNHLRLAARSDPAAADDAALIESKADAITRAIEHEFMLGYALLCDLDCTQELSIAQLRAARDEADAMARGMRERDERMASLVETVRDRCRPQLVALCKCLERILGYSIDPLHNPLAPATLCPAVWSAFATHCRTPRVERELQAMIVREFGPALAGLLDLLAKDIDQRTDAS